MALEGCPQAYAMMHSSTEPWPPRGKAPAARFRILQLKSLLESLESTDHDCKPKDAISHAFRTTIATERCTTTASQAIAGYAASLPAVTTFFFMAYAELLPLRCQVAEPYFGC